MLHNKLALKYDPSTFRRRIGEKEVIIHCHHYNARLQGTIESAGQIDGQHIIRSSAESVFSEYLAGLLDKEYSNEEKWQAAEMLYSHLGFGKLDMSNIESGVVTASTSHFVEGWKAGFQEREEPVCTFTEGYIQGAMLTIEGKTVNVRETDCMITGSSQCRFEITEGRSTPSIQNPKMQSSFLAKTSAEFERSPNIDEQQIIDALVAMPIYGNEEGLIPAFNVYLGNMPADFYNLVSIMFIEEMAKINMEIAAKKLLTYCGEICGLHTFRGIMNSAEWDGLIAPMVREPRDNLFGIITVSNGLGWGNWHVKDHQEATSLTLESLNGYEALGFRDYRGSSDASKCYMLTGVSSGIMELLYTEGTIEDRFGTFHAKETSCITNGAESCIFQVTKV